MLDMHTFNVPVSVSIEVSEHCAITDLVFPNKNEVDGVKYLVLRVRVISPQKDIVTHGEVSQQLHRKNYILTGWKTASDSLRKSIMDGIRAYRRQVSANITNFQLCMYGDNRPDGWFTVFGWGERITFPSETGDDMCQIAQRNPTDLFIEDQFILATLPRED